MNRVKFFLIFIISISSFINLYGQDIIVKKDGSELKVRLVKITKDSIYYKPYSNLKSKTISISKKNVLVVNKSEKEGFIEDDYGKEEKKETAEKTEKVKVVDASFKKTAWELYGSIGVGSVSAYTPSDTMGNYGYGAYWNFGASFKFRFTRVFGLEAGFVIDKMPLVFEYGTIIVESELKGFHFPVKVNLTFGHNVKFMLKAGLTYGTLFPATYAVCDRGRGQCSSGNINDALGNYFPLIVHNNINIGVIIPSYSGEIYLYGSLISGITPYFEQFIESGSAIAVTVGFGF